MSLKAKIEAVIYASEEPVTLAQLIGLLGEEGQVELDTLASNQLSFGTGERSGQDTGETSFPDDDVTDEDSLNAELLNTQEASLGPDAPAEAVILSEDPQSKDAGAADTAATAEPVSATETTEPATPDAKALAAEQKLATRRLRDYFRSLLDQLIAEYATGDRGLEIKEVANGYRFATKPEYHDAVRGFVKSLKPPLKLSLQALETLAVVAYKQPVTSPEVTEIRGVESAGTLGSLMTRKLVTTAGRKQVIGRPILYKTTKDFLLRFGLKDINELPSIEEFEKMAGELNEAVQEEMAMEAEIDMEESANPETTPDGTEEAQEHAGTETSSQSTALDELNAVPEPTHILHDTPEDLIGDDSSKPEGSKHEPTRR